jgi:hypothetical protein
VAGHDTPEVQRNNDHQPRVERYETVAGMQQAPTPCPIDQLLGPQNPRPQQTRMGRESEDEHQWHDDESQPSADPRRFGGAHVGVPIAGTINCQSSRHLDPADGRADTGDHVDELECVLIPSIVSRRDPSLPESKVQSRAPEQSRNGWSRR